MGIDATPAISIQVHYDNPDGDAGQVDNSGVNIFYVREPREHLLGVLSPITLSLDFNTEIPPQRKRHFITTGCEVTGLTRPVRLMQITWHAHLLGREMYTDVYPGGVGGNVSAASPAAARVESLRSTNLIGRSIE